MVDNHSFSKSVFVHGMKIHLTIKENVEFIVNTVVMQLHKQWI